MSNKSRLVDARGPRVNIFGMGLLALDVIEGRDYTFESLGGTCGNVMALLSWLGWNSFPVARIGTDDAATYIMNEMKQIGIFSNHVILDESSATPIIIQVNRTDKDGNRFHRYVLTCPGCGKWLPRFRPTTISQIQHIIESATVPEVFFFDRISPSSLKLAKWTRDHGGLIVFEPSSIGDISKFQQAVSISHVLKFADDRLGKFHDIRNFAGPDLIVHTLGANGITFRFQKDWYEMQPFEALSFHDSAGSGDWCTAFMLNELRVQNALMPTKWTHDLLERSLKAGQAAAATNCNFEGARGAMQAMGKTEIIATIENLADGNTAVIRKVKSTKSTSNSINLCSLCNSLSSPKTSNSVSA